jgi:dolichol-phosphate mannosyltransferase
MSKCDALPAQSAIFSEPACATQPKLKLYQYQITVLTTARDEAANVEPFLREVEAGLDRLTVSGEIVFIDDCSSDGTSEAVVAYCAQHGERYPIRLVRHDHGCGIAAAIGEGAALARGELLCLLPADLESLPSADLPALYGALREDVDVVAGCRQGRGDGKVLASRLYRILNRLLFGVKVRDPNWIKLIRAQALEGVQMRPGWHRFLLAILVDRGCRVVEVPTAWHSRRAGKSKFGVSRFPGALADIIAVKYHLSCRRRPLAFLLVLAAKVKARAAQRRPRRPKGSMQ